MKSRPSKILSTDTDGNLSAHIETPNLMIRSIQEDDLGHLIGLMGDERVMQFVGAGGARDSDRIGKLHRDLINLWKDGKPISGFMVFKKDSGNFAGMACLEEVKKDGAPKAGEAEVMLYFRPDFWGQGYGKEVGKAFLESLLGMMKEGVPMEIAGSPITKVVATAHPGNEGSIKLQKSLGFNEVGIEDKLFTTPTGEKELRPRVLFELDLQRLLEAPRRAASPSRGTVTLEEVGKENSGQEYTGRK